MDAGGARFLAETLDQDFDFLANSDHEVGQFVDNQYNEGQGLVIELLFLVQFFARFGIEARLHAAPQWRTLLDRLLHLFVEARDVA